MVQGRLRGPAGAVTARLGPEAAPPPCPHRHVRGPQRRTACYPGLGAEPTGVVGALLTLAEVGEDMVHPELGGGPTHLGVAEAEAAAAAGWIVGLQVKGPWATPEMRGQPCPQAT